MSPQPLASGGPGQPLALWLCRSWCWALGAGMRSPSRIALGFGLSGSCGVCHALVLPGWVILHPLSRWWLLLILTPPAMPACPSATGLG